MHNNINEERKRTTPKTKSFQAAETTREKRETLYSIPDPAQKTMDELIVNIREKLQQIIRSQA